MTDTNPKSDTTKDTPDRIAKVMARAGIASRREAERMIIEGRVTVNGRKIDSPALDVQPSDRITVDGTPLEAPQETRLWLYYKPTGLITSESDEKGRQTVFDALPRDLPRVMTVGRLDLNSEGLLLLTNDGDLKRRLELPATGWLRRYRVRVNGTPNDLSFAPLRRGVVIDGEEFAPMEIKLDSQQGANAWLTVGIREGKNREIRRAMTHIGLQVNRLIRVGYGPFKLATMEKNEVLEVKRRVLRDQLGGLLTGEVEEKPREMRPRGAAGAQPPREGDSGAGPRRFGAKPAGAKPYGGRSRDDGEGRPDRARSGFQGKPGGGRPEFGDRPRPASDKPRWAGAEGGDRKPAGDRPRDGEGGRPARFAGKPGEARKPFGKPGGFSANRQEGGRGKPAAASSAPSEGYAGGKPGGRSHAGKPPYTKPAGERFAGGKFSEGGRKDGAPRADGGAGERPGRPPFGGKPGGYAGKPGGKFSEGGRKDGAPRADGGAGERPGRPPFGGKPGGYAGKPGGKFSEGGRKDGAPRADGGAGERPGRPPFGGKPGGYAGKPGGKFSEGGRKDGAPRADGGAGERPGRPPFGGRPGGYAGKPGGKPGGYTGKPGGKPGGGFSGKPGGKPGGRPRG